MMNNPQAETTEDRFFGGALSLVQPRQGHRAGTDAVLIAQCLPEGALRIADLGAATGIIGLRAAQLNPAACVILFEREAALLPLARKNIAGNALDARVSLCEADVFRLGGDDRFRETFDCVLTNPPFYDSARARISPDEARARAHAFSDGETLDGWLRAATAILAPKGQLLMIHVASEIEPIIAAMAGRFGAAKARFVHPDAEKPAIRVIISGVKGNRGPLQILPPLILNEPHGSGFTPEMAAVHRGERRIAM
jgi:tRNA1(Val) A37 N6-methylase TrmN6